MSTDQLVTEAGEIDLRVLVAILWRSRWLILFVAFAFALAAGIYAVTSKKWYRADVSFVQVENRSSPAGLGQLGGLASLAGINISGGADTKVPMAVLRSRELLREFISEQGLLPGLLKEMACPPPAPGKEPQLGKECDVRDATRYFDEELREIDEDRGTGVVTLSVTWVDPSIAAAWANLLVRSANERLRKEAEEEAERSIAFLQREIVATNVSVLQQSLAQVLESEMQKLLLARGSEEFAFRVVDSAVPPRIKVRPKGSLYAALGGLLGGALGVAAVLAVPRLRRGIVRPGR